MSPTERVESTIRFVEIRTTDIPEDFKAAGVEAFAVYEFTRDVGDPDEWSHLFNQSVSRAGGGPDPNGNPIWKWSGSREAPTLTPSLVWGDLERDGWRVHLFLRAGVIEPCGDMTTRVA